MYVILMKLLISNELVVDPHKIFLSLRWVFNEINNATEKIFVHAREIMRSSEW